MKENDIQKEDWRKYFMGLLGGTEEHVGENMRESNNAWTEERNEKQILGSKKMLDEEEIIRAVRKMKLGKATGN